jgi:hypothetical protein
MINEAVKFLTDEVNKYLDIKLGHTTDNRLVPGNIARAFDSDAGGVTNTLSGKAIVSLINLEEDRLSKLQDPFVKIDNRVVYKNPAVPLNMYLLFAVNLQKYDESLNLLGYIIRFFQNQFVFTTETNPTLDPKIGKLIADLYTLSFEQVNHLWGTLGGKYLPSVLYKIRLVTVDEEIPYATGEFITEIDIENKMKAPLS